MFKPPIVMYRHWRYLATVDDIIMSWDMLKDYYGSVIWTFTPLPLHMRRASLEATFSDFIYFSRRQNDWLDIDVMPTCRWVVWKLFWRRFETSCTQLSSSIAMAARSWRLSSAPLRSCLPCRTSLMWVTWLRAFRVSMATCSSASNREGNRV